MHPGVFLRGSLRNLPNSPHVICQENYSRKPLLKSLLRWPCWSFAYLQSTSCRLQAQGRKINTSPKSSKEGKKNLLAHFTAFPKFFLLIVVKSFCVKASASIKSSYMLQSHVFPFKLRFAECQPLDIINSKFVVSCCSSEPELGAEGAGFAGSPRHTGDPRVAGARGEPRCPRWGFFMLVCKV